MASQIQSSSSNSTSDDWTLSEKIRLLELYIDNDRDMIWEKRAEILQKEFSRKRPAEFFNQHEVKKELYRILSKSNPEHHINGVMPAHSRSKEAAELWLNYFRKELVKHQEQRKQLFVVAMRRQMDLIRRFQQGKVTPEEMEATLLEVRERDAKRFIPNREEYEANLKKMMDKIHENDYKKIRDFSDYCNYLRGERLPTPPPEPEFNLQSLMSTSSALGQNELTLKGITIQRKAKTAKRLELAVQKILQKNSERIIANESEKEKHQFGGKSNTTFSDIQNQAKPESESTFEDLSSSATQFEEMKEENQILETKQTEVGVEIHIRNARLDGTENNEQNALFSWPHKAGETNELSTHESVLTKISASTFAFTGQCEAMGSAQTVLAMPNTMQISLSVNLVSSTAAMQKDEEIISGPVGKALSPTAAIAPQSPEKAKSPAEAAKKSLSPEKHTTTASMETEESRRPQRRKQPSKVSSEEVASTQRNLRRTMTISHVPERPTPPVTTPGRKRKRGELEKLTVAEGEVIPVEETLPSAKNLRRSSQQFSPAPTSSTAVSIESSSTTTPENKESLLMSVKKEHQQQEAGTIKHEPAENLVTPTSSTMIAMRKASIGVGGVISEIAATTKLRSSIRRKALASATPSPAVNSVGENDLFLRPGNHTSNEPIPKQVLLTLWKDITSHKSCHYFNEPVMEEEVPGYHSAIKQPMDMRTIKALIDAGTIQTFGQFRHSILRMFANAVMYNSTGHEVNTSAKKMLAFALDCIDVVQYPAGQLTSTNLLIGGSGTGDTSRQSNTSGSEPGDGRNSRSSSGISSSTTSNTTRATKGKHQGSSTPTTHFSAGVADFESSEAEMKEEIEDDQHQQPSTSNTNAPIPTDGGHQQLSASKSGINLRSRRKH